MKAIMLSVKPKWCVKIANGRKTVEVRKTRPILDTPFRVFIYCTKGNPKDPYEWLELHHYDDSPIQRLNGKVIGEFICRKVEHFDSEYSEWAYAVAPSGSVMPMHESKAFSIMENDGCLTSEDIRGYFPERINAFFWHISDVVIYDAPKELSEFHLPPEKYCEKGLCGGCPYDQVPNEYNECEFDCEWKRPLKKAPQSWCYVEVLAKGGNR